MLRRPAALVAALLAAALLVASGTAAAVLDHTRPVTVRVPQAISNYDRNTIDRRLLPDVEFLVARYRIGVNDACGTTPPHARRSEHLICAALDLGPGPRGSWARVDRLARDLGWRRGCAARGCWRAPTLHRALRAIFYTGYPGHGRGHHLHLEWRHARVPDRVYRANARGRPRAVARWVATLVPSSGPRG